MMGLIHGNNRSDYFNILFGQFDWGPMLARVIHNRLTKNMSLDSLLPPQ